MFGTIRKHQTWLWLFLIALMSVSLVVFFSSDASLTSQRNRGGYDCGSVNGLPIPSDECLSARKEIFIARFLRTGKWPGNDEQTSRELDNEVAGRVFLIRKLKEYNIQPSDKAIALQMHAQIRDMPLAELESRFLASQNLTSMDYERFVRHEVGREQLMAAAATSGKLIRPNEAETLYRKEHQETEVQLAMFWSSNFTDKVVITNEAIGLFYTNRGQFTYRIPERTILSYVEFPATNYYTDADKEIGSVTNLDARLTQIYYQRNTNDAFFKDDKGNALSEADAKKKIRDRDRAQLALVAARRAANDFGTALMESKATPGLDPDANKLGNFEKLAVLRSIPVKLAKPFDALTGLEEFDAPTNSILETEENFRASIRRASASLTDAAPIRFNPLVAPHAVFLIARKGTVPSELPPLEKIADKVTNDYRNFMARELMFKAGAAFGTNVTNGLTLKKPFADLCKADGVQPVDVPPFSDSTQSLTNFDARINLGMLQRLARDLEPGNASHFQPFSQEGGLVLYVRNRPKIDDATVKAALTEYVGQLRLYRQYEAFNQWFMKQATDAKLSPPRRTNETAGLPN